MPRRGQFKHDLAGARFGELLVLERDHTPRRHVHWWCRCICTAVVSVAGFVLQQNRTKSCGCLRRQLVGESNNRHGHTRDRRESPEHKAWSGMFRRCRSKRPKWWFSYGSRGIKVCRRWRVFENFLTDMGPRPSTKHSIDRINNAGGYKPSNCRWATVKEQAMNRRPRRWQVRPVSPTE